MPYLIPNNSYECWTIHGADIGQQNHHTPFFIIFNYVYANVFAYILISGNIQMYCVLFSLFYVSNSASFLFAKYSFTITSKT